MALAPGVRLGSYEIVSTLGAGGMGQVYRARDTKLNRSVAIKAITELFASDPDWIARLDREAQALAALNHPNIAHIYGLERQDGRERPDALVSYIVMELVDGEELAQRIARGPIPLDEALPIAAQIAEALEAAHDQGIVHRDLKPANIKIRDDGTVKVLDFGLAKAMDVSPGSLVRASISPTLSVQATQAGIILGTAAYMSPEQARGRLVDKRADIWAFGVVLYEMVTGRKPFHGSDVGEVLASVIKEQPSWDDVPAPLRRLLQRCLEKDPKKRLRDISGVALLLEDPPARLPPLPASTRAAWASAGIAAVLALIALWAPWRTTRSETGPVVRLDVDLGADVALRSAQQGTDVIISPDGTRLAWVSRNRLFTRRLDQDKAIELVNAQAVIAPFFSPDGRWIGFFSGEKLRKISVDGGAAVELCAAPRGFGGWWGEDGRIVASLDGMVLSSIPDSGGQPSAITQLMANENAHRYPHLLRGGRAVLFTARGTSNSFDEANIDVLSLPDGKRKTVQKGGAYGRYVAAPNGKGFLVYVNRSTLFAADFDLDRLEVRGAPVPIIDQIAYNSLNGTAQFDVSQTGTLVYVAGTARVISALHWLDANGNLEALPFKAAALLQPRLSPDGKLLAVSLLGARGQDIWVYDGQRDAQWPVTFGENVFSFPVWTTDSRFLVFNGRGGIFWARADGGSKPQRLIESAEGLFPWSFSPEGTRLAYAGFTTGAGDIWTVPVDGSSGGLKAGKAEPYLQTATNELFPAFSPDGRWIAYRTFESGTSEIQVRAFPDTGGKWLISNNGGSVPVWSPKSRELFYRTDDQRIMVVPYSVKGDAFVADRPRQWSDVRLLESSQRNLDITPDGKRFVVMMPADLQAQAVQNRVTFIENFADDLQRRFGTLK